MLASEHVQLLGSTALYLCQDGTDSQQLGQIHNQSLHVLSCDAEHRSSVTWLVLHQRAATHSTHTRSFSSSPSTCTSCLLQSLVILLFSSGSHIYPLHPPSSHQHFLLLPFPNPLSTPNHTPPPPPPPPPPPLAAQWLSNCVDVGSVSCVISRLAHKAQCILGHMQRRRHERERFWFDQGSAACYTRVVWLEEPAASGRVRKHLIRTGLQEAREGRKQGGKENRGVEMKEALGGPSGKHNTTFHCRHDDCDDYTTAVFTKCERPWTEDV
ncbi:unnamed protein product [Pleuronectes platessa]|uniref:Uncharacterized protein n=1 Tax=Pleuronectes platessa TaxID=8262 RepID=A0A9N7VHQ7_PLEPL|nr:unnamed protein product [Pleuronectes platessa]